MSGDETESEVYPDIMSSPPVSSRPVTPADTPLLYEIYASTRRREVEAFGWPPAQQEAFLRMQFDVRRRGYEATYPAAEHTILLYDAAPIGSMIVSRGSSAFDLLDIAILPEFRNRGFGASLLAGLIGDASAAGVPVRLMVLRGNPAIHLYQRLGFVVTSGDAVYLEMKYDSRGAQQPDI